MDLSQAIHNTRSHLLSLRNEAGHWEGHLSSSALSTATAIVALSTVDSDSHADETHRGANWLITNQNTDGGWGDTTISKGNLSTTLLCWSALHLVARNQACACPDESSNRPSLRPGQALAKVEAWITATVGSLKPEDISKAVIARYGKDKTFSVPILMLCAICGTLGKEGWRRVLPLPFELAALPRRWFGAIGLPVVSYALPALIAIGYARHFHAPFAWWNPLRWLKRSLWPRISPMLKELQPSTGGYLEATPLTSFVTMALASAGQKHHPCVPEAVRFILASERPDGSWPIDTNLATWSTTLASRALFGQDSTSNQSDANRTAIEKILEWLLAQQYKVEHPFTNAAPGGWAWTDLPGGVPDADDTSGALCALWQLTEGDEPRRTQLIPTVEAGITWLLDLQNRDGGMPTFCRGWGTLPFDRSTPEITAHALHAYSLWKDRVSPTISQRIDKASLIAFDYLGKTQREDGSWIPLWFGNEHAPEEDNPVHGTTMVLQVLGKIGPLDKEALQLQKRALKYLLQNQSPDGGWGGAIGVLSSVEETANAVTALAIIPESPSSNHTDSSQLRDAIQRGVTWLLQATNSGTKFPASPIGLYFARLWYHEEMYPVIWTLNALQSAQKALKNEAR